MHLDAHPLQTRLTAVSVESPDFDPIKLPRGFAGRPVVCVQGLGFVGAAMAVAAALAVDDREEPCFGVIGIDLDTSRGRRSIDLLKSGDFPFDHGDNKLSSGIKIAHEQGNLTATSDPRAFGLAAVILVDINLDLAAEGTGQEDRNVPRLELGPFREAIRSIGNHVSPGALIIIETTVPPGTCERVVAPELARSLAHRGLCMDDILLAHSYERVMPGVDYLDSLINYWRVYAGHTEAAANACADFFSKIVNVQDYPLHRLSSMTASETAKVLENSYRAVNIAFIEEWSRFAEAVGVDLFEVVGAIRCRPTHANLRQPGFGVGGYCLPKDPLLAYAAAQQLFAHTDLDFPFCRMAVATNRSMPMASVAAVESMLGGSLSEKRLLLLGVSYRPGVADTRHSPSETFCREAMARGARVLVHDPIVRHWPEMELHVDARLPAPEGLDALVFAVPHADYGSLDFSAWLNSRRPCVLDANNVLSARQRTELRSLGCPVRSIGRGET